MKFTDVQLAFSSRIRTYHAWQNADSNAKRAKQTHETNRAQGKIPLDQVNRALAVVGDVRDKADP